jgi:hypothetical protein
MKREILICDRCHASAETESEKKELALGDIAVGFGTTYHSYPFQGSKVYPGHSVWNAQWCHKCRLELGIAGTPSEVFKKPEAEVPSLEDMVREIVREEVQQGGN